MFPNFQWKLFIKNYLAIHFNAFCCSSGLVLIFFFFLNLDFSIKTLIFLARIAFLSEMCDSFSDALIQ